MEAVDCVALMIDTKVISLVAVICESVLPAWSRREQTRQGEAVNSIHVMILTPSWSHGHTTASIEGTT